ncbi:MAG: sensor histidine kinase [Chloroflexi bacterium]|nr:sensor histidine kinase [Chloroflexota bacterium]
MRPHAGIPAAARGHIFERFYQAGSGPAAHGLGLGLYVSRLLIERHGGKLTAEYPTGGGTRFVIELPTRDVRHRDQSECRAPTRIRARVPGASPSRRAR